VELGFSLWGLSVNKWLLGLAVLWPRLAEGDAMLLGGQDVVKLRSSWLLSFCLHGRGRRRVHGHGDRNRDGLGLVVSLDELVWHRDGAGLEGVVVRLGWGEKSLKHLEIF